MITEDRIYYIGFIAVALNFLLTIVLRGVSIIFYYIIISIFLSMLILLMSIAVKNRKRRRGDDKDRKRLFKSSIIWAVFVLMCLSYYFLIITGVAPLP